MADDPPFTTPAPYAMTPTIRLRLRWGPRDQDQARAMLHVVATSSDEALRRWAADWLAHTAITELAL